MSDYDKRVDELAAGMAHTVLPEQVRLENALNIWVRDMREQELAKVKQGGRLSVAALAYEEVLKLRKGLQHIFSDRRRKIKGRWERRKAKRAARKAHEATIRASIRAEHDRHCGCRKGTVLCPH